MICIICIRAFAVIKLIKIVIHISYFTVVPGFGKDFKNLRRKGFKIFFLELKTFS